MERTLVLVKPEGVQRHLVGKIITRFEDAGLKIVGMKQAWVNKEFAKKHYHDVPERHGKKIFNQLIEYMTGGPVVAMVLEGSSAIENVRKIIGPTESKSALPGTIRGDFAHADYSHFDTKEKAIRNLVHASGNKKDAKIELPLWFNENELHSFKTVQDFLM